jgi:hypothetical protein
MPSYSKTEEYSIQLLKDLEEEDEELFLGIWFINYFHNDINVAGKVVKLLLATQMIKQEHSIFSDGSSLPSWANATYAVTSKAILGLAAHEREENPFRDGPKNTHHGDVYHTSIDKNQGTVSIGKKSVSNYYGNAEQSEEIARLIREMIDSITYLPKAEKEDAEYQINKLSEAAKAGPEAVIERQYTFMRWLTGMKDAVETAQAALVIYKLAVLLFIAFGIDVKPIPDGF